MNDKVSVRFFYNLGIEYFKFLQQVYGYGGVMAMIDGDSVTSGYDHSPPAVSDVDTNVQLVSDFQQLNFDSNEIEAQSPSKVRKQPFLLNMNVSGVYDRKLESNIKR